MWNETEKGCTEQYGTVVIIKAYIDSVEIVKLLQIVSH